MKSLKLGIVLVVGLAIAVTLEGCKKSDDQKMVESIGLDSLWGKAYSSGQGIGSGIEIGKPYLVTGAVNGDLTELTSATSAYDHNAIYGAHDFDDDGLRQYESFLQSYKGAEESNSLLVCGVVVSMGNDHKFRFHRIVECHTAEKLRY